jgi:hypothetical protein
MCGDRETKAIGTIVGGYFGGLEGATAGNAIASATVSNNPAVAAPVMAPTPVMPTMDSTSVAAAQRLSTQRLLAQGGRSATILSQASNQTLGG